MPAVKREKEWLRRGSTVAVLPLLLLTLIAFTTFLVVDRLQREAQELRSRAYPLELPAGQCLSAGQECGGSTQCCSGLSCDAFSGGYFCVSDQPSSSCVNGGDPCNPGSTPCCDGAQCAPFSGGSFCVAPNCQNGTRQCSGDFVQECQSGQFVNIQRCDYGCSNSQCNAPPADVCPNLSGSQASVPTGYVLQSGQCVLSSSTSPAQLSPTPTPTTTLTPPETITEEYVPGCIDGVNCPGDGERLRQWKLLHPDASDADYFANGGPYQNFGGGTTGSGKANLLPTDENGNPVLPQISPTPGDRLLDTSGFSEKKLQNIAACESSGGSCARGYGQNSCTFATSDIGVRCICEGNYTWPVYVQDPACGGSKTAAFGTVLTQEQLGLPGGGFTATGDDCTADFARVTVTNSIDEYRTVEDCTRKGQICAKDRQGNAGCADPAAVVGASYKQDSLISNYSCDATNNAITVKYNGPLQNLAKRLNLARDEYQKCKLNEVCSEYGSYVSCQPLSVAQQQKADIYQGGSCLGSKRVVISPSEQFAGGDRQTRTCDPGYVCVGSRDASGSYARCAFSTAEAARVQQEREQARIAAIRATMICTDGAGAQLKDGQLREAQVGGDHAIQACLCETNSDGTVKVTNDRAVCGLKVVQTNLQGGAGESCRSERNILGLSQSACDGGLACYNSLCVGGCGGEGALPCSNGCAPGLSQETNDKGVNVCTSTERTEVAGVTRSTYECIDAENLKTTSTTGSRFGGQSNEVIQRCDGLCNTSTDRCEPDPVEVAQMRGDILQTAIEFTRAECLAERRNADSCTAANLYEKALSNAGKVADELSPIIKETFNQSNQFNLPQDVYQKLIDEEYSKRLGGAVITSDPFAASEYSPDVYITQEQADALYQQAKQKVDQTLSIGALNPGNIDSLDAGNEVWDQISEQDYFDVVDIATKGDAGFFERLFNPIAAVNWWFDVATATGVYTSSKFEPTQNTFSGYICGSNILGNELGDQYSACYQQKKVQETINNCDIKSWQRELTAVQEACLKGESIAVKVNIDALQEERVQTAALIVASGVLATVTGGAGGALAQGASRLVQFSASVLPQVAVEIAATPLFADIYASDAQRRADVFAALASSSQATIEEKAVWQAKAEETQIEADQAYQSELINGFITAVAANVGFEGLTPLGKAIFGESTIGKYLFDWNSFFGPKVVDNIADEFLAGNGIKWQVSGEPEIPETLIPARTELNIRQERSNGSINYTKTTSADFLSQSSKVEKGTLITFIDQEGKTRLLKAVGNGEFVEFKPDFPAGDLRLALPETTDSRVGELALLADGLNSNVVLSETRMAVAGGVVEPEFKGGILKIWDPDVKTPTPLLVAAEAADKSLFSQPGTVVNHTSPDGQVRVFVTNAQGELVEMLSYTVDPLTATLTPAPAFTSSEVNKIAGRVVSVDDIEQVALRTAEGEPVAVVGLGDRIGASVDRVRQTIADAVENVPCTIAYFGVTPAYAAGLVPCGNITVTPESGTNEARLPGLPVILHRIRRFNSLPVTPYLLIDQIPGTEQMAHLYTGDKLVINVSDVGPVAITADGINGPEIGVFVDNQVDPSLIPQGTAYAFIPKPEKTVATLGRQGTLVISDPRVSRYQAEIVLATEGRLYIRNNGQAPVTVDRGTGAIPVARGQFAPIEDRAVIKIGDNWTRRVVYEPEKTLKLVDLTDQAETVLDIGTPLIKPLVDAVESVKKAVVNAADKAVEVVAPAPKGQKPVVSVRDKIPAKAPVPEVPAPQAPQIQVRRPTVNEGESVSLVYGESEIPINGLEDLDVQPVGRQIVVRTANSQRSYIVTEPGKWKVVSPAETIVGVPKMLEGQSVWVNRNPSVLQPTMISATVTEENLLGMSNGVEISSFATGKTYVKRNDLFELKETAPQSHNDGILDMVANIGSPCDRLGFHLIRPVYAAGVKPPCPINLRGVVKSVNDGITSVGNTTREATNNVQRYLTYQKEGLLVWLDENLPQPLAKQLKPIGQPPQLKPKIDVQVNLNQTQNALSAKYQGQSRPEIAQKIIDQAAQMLLEDRALVTLLDQYDVLSKSALAGGDDFTVQALIITALDLVETNKAANDQIAKEIEEAISLALTGKYGENALVADDPLVDILQHDRRVFFVDRETYLRERGHEYGAFAGFPSQAIVISKGYQDLPKGTRIAVTIHEAIHEEHFGSGAYAEIDAHIDPQFRTPIKEAFTIAAEDSIMTQSSYGIRPTKRQSDQAAADILTGQVFPAVRAKTSPERADWLIFEARYGNMNPLIKTLGDGDINLGWTRLQEYFASNGAVIIPAPQIQVRRPIVNDGESVLLVYGESKIPINGLEDLDVQPVGRQIVVRTANSQRSYIVTEPGKWKVVSPAETIVGVPKSLEGQSVFVNRDPSVRQPTLISTRVTEENLLGMSNGVEISSFATGKTYVKRNDLFELKETAPQSHNDGILDNVANIGSPCDRLGFRLIPVAYAAGGALPPCDINLRNLTQKLGEALENLFGGGRSGGEEVVPQPQGETPAAPVKQVVSDLKQVYTGEIPSIIDAAQNGQLIPEDVDKFMEQLENGRIKITHEKQLTSAGLDKTGAYSINIHPDDSSKPATILHELIHTEQDLRALESGISLEQLKSDPLFNRALFEIQAIQIEKQYLQKWGGDPEDILGTDVHEDFWKDELVSIGESVPGNIDQPWSVTPQNPSTPHLTPAESNIPLQPTSQTIPQIPLGAPTLPERALNTVREVVFGSEAQITPANLLNPETRVRVARQQYIDNFKILNVTTKDGAVNKVATTRIALSEPKPGETPRTFVFIPGFGQLTSLPDPTVLSFAEQGNFNYLIAAALPEIPRTFGADRNFEADSEAILEALRLTNDIQYLIDSDVVVSGYSEGSSVAVTLGAKITNAHEVNTLLFSSLGLANINDGNPYVFAGRFAVEVGKIGLARWKTLPEYNFPGMPPLNIVAKLIQVSRDLFKVLRRADVPGVISDLVTDIKNRFTGGEVFSERTNQLRSIASINEYLDQHRGKGIYYVIPAFDTTAPLGTEIIPQLVSNLQAKGVNVPGTPTPDQYAHIIAQYLEVPDSHVVIIGKPGDIHANHHIPTINARYVVGTALDTIDPKFKLPAEASEFPAVPPAPAQETRFPISLEEDLQTRVGPFTKAEWGETAFSGLLRIASAYPEVTHIIVGRIEDMLATNDLPLPPEYSGFTSWQDKIDFLQNHKEILGDTAKVFLANHKIDGGVIAAHDFTKEEILSGENFVNSAINKVVNKFADIQGLHFRVQLNVLDDGQVFWIVFLPEGEFVVRTKQTNLSLDEINSRVEKFSGVVPKVRVEQIDDTTVAFLSAYTEFDRNKFDLARDGKAIAEVVKSLGALGVVPDYVWDGGINFPNFVKDPQGRILYIDRDLFDAIASESPLQLTTGKIAEYNQEIEQFIDQYNSVVPPEQQILLKDYQLPKADSSSLPAGTEGQASPEKSWIEDNITDPVADALEKIFLKGCDGSTSFTPAYPHIYADRINEGTSPFFRSFRSGEGEYQDNKREQKNYITSEQISDSKTIHTELPFFANSRLINHNPSVTTNPNTITTQSVLSTPPTSGDTTAIPKNTWPELSRIFDNRTSWAEVSTGFRDAIKMSPEGSILSYFNKNENQLSNGWTPPFVSPAYAQDQGLAPRRGCPLPQFLVGPVRGLTQFIRERLPKMSHRVILERMGLLPAQKVPTPAEAPKTQVSDGGGTSPNQLDKQDFTPKVELSRVFDERVVQTPDGKIHTIEYGENRGATSALLIVDQYNLYDLSGTTNIKISEQDVVVTVRDNRITISNLHETILDENNLTMQAKESNNILADLYRKELTARSEIEQQLVGQIDQPIIVTKTNLNPNSQFPIQLAPDDQIEIRIELDSTGIVVWYIRNATVAEQPLRTSPIGKVTEGTADDVLAFIDKVDPNKIGTHKLTPIPKEMTEDTTGKKKILVFRNDAGEIAGIVYFTDNGSTSAFINILATDPDLENSGVGTALLNALKQKYESLSLNAVPFDPRADPAVAFQRLKEFYKHNGFTAASQWSRQIVSLDDLASAGNWQRIDDSIYSVGADQHYIPVSDLKQKIYEQILNKQDLYDSLLPDTRTKLQEWFEINSRVDSLEKDVDELYRQIEISRRQARKISLSDQPANSIEAAAKKLVEGCEISSLQPRISWISADKTSGPENPSEVNSFMGGTVGLAGLDDDVRKQEEQNHKERISNSSTGEEIVNRYGHNLLLSDNQAAISKLTIPNGKFLVNNSRNFSGEIPNNPGDIKMAPNQPEARLTNTPESDSRTVFRDGKNISSHANTSVLPSSSWPFIPAAYAQEGNLLAEAKGCNFFVQLALNVLPQSLRPNVTSWLRNTGWQMSNITFLRQLGIIDQIGRWMWEKTSASMPEAPEVPPVPEIPAVPPAPAGVPQNLPVVESYLEGTFEDLDQRQRARDYLTLLDSFNIQTQLSDAEMSETNLLRIGGKILQPLSRVGGFRFAYDLGDGRVLKTERDVQSEKELFIWLTKSDIHPYLARLHGWGRLKDGSLYLIQDVITPISGYRDFETSASDIKRTVEELKRAWIENSERQQSSVENTLTASGLKNLSELERLEKIGAIVSPLHITDLSLRNFGRTATEEIVLFDWGVTKSYEFESETDFPTFATTIEIDKLMQRRK